MDHPHLRDRRRRAAPPVLVGVLVVVAALLLGACADSSSRSLIGGSTTTAPTTTTSTIPEPEPLLQPPPGFRIPDTRNAVLLPAKGKGGAPAPIPVRGGTSSVSGTVRGPDGPVGGATVRIERFVGSASGSITVSTDGSGRFGATGLLGGRYRARAWLQPALATLDAPTGFVAAGDRLSLDIGVERHDAIALQVASAVATLTVGIPAPVNGLLTQESVDADGIVRTAGLAGVSISLATTGALTIAGTNPATTGADGRVQWIVVCQSPGTYQVSASSTTPPAGGGTTLPNCAEPAPTTTSSTAAPPGDGTGNGNGNGNGGNR